MMRALLVVALAASTFACRAHTTPSNWKAPDAGVSIALYAAGEDSYGVVDDRRWVDVAGTTMMLANIDPGAELASLVLEPATTELHVDQCVRDRMPDVDAAKIDPLEAYAEAPRARRAAELNRRLEALGRPPLRQVVPEPSTESTDRFIPVVKCNVRAKPGRYLVRVLYVTKALSYRAQHDIDVKDARAEVTSRFAITTPVWQTRAELVLFDGIPGGERVPREVARGQATLDGSTSVLTVPATNADAQLRRVYEGAVITSDDSTDVSWGNASSQEIRVWLELAKLRLAPGPIRVHLDVTGEGVRDLDVPQASRKQEDDETDAPLRLPLWIDESLRGSRQRLVEYNDGNRISERYMFGVANLGETEREVFVEEPLRTATRRKLERAWPKKPTADHNVLRTKLDVKPGRIERTGYSMTYDF